MLLTENNYLHKEIVESSKLRKDIPSGVILLNPLELYLFQEYFHIYSDVRSSL